MDTERKRKLEKNFYKIFFINALLNVKMLSSISSLFYVYRSLTVPEIFYLGIVFSATVVLSEVPSSYLADRFGRKRTVIMAALFGLLHWVFFLIADSFLLFAIGTLFFALAESFMSGTDEAFIYDTNKELGRHTESLKKLSWYLSSERVFKIASAFLGALIAKDLLEWQFSLVIFVDIFASIIAVFFAWRLVEPQHYMDVEKQEAGLIKDAYKILSTDRRLLVAIASKVVIFIMGASMWRYAAVLFVDNLGISIIVFGLLWSLYQAFVFIGNQFSHRIWPHKTDSFKIQMLNYLFVVSVAVFVVSWFFFPFKFVLCFAYIATQTASSLRDPFFSHLFNQQFNSYNRATALSLANFTRNIFDLPIIPLMAWAVGRGLVWPYVISLLFGLAVVIFLNIDKVKPRVSYEPKTI